MKIEQSKKLFKEANKLFPGGVNSPVRAFKSVKGDPLFIKKGEGCLIWDEDGNEYIDFCCSWGPLILGHAHPSVKEKVIEAVNNGTSFGTPTALENELGKLVLDNHQYVEKIRFVSSGTEAAMSAIRLARGYSGKDKVIKFEGCYHGHVDGLLVNAGSGLATFGTASSAGIPQGYVNETIVLPLNDKEALLQAVEQHKGNIACIALEPIPANNGLLLQGGDFLRFLRELCDKEGILLFFDEVISGFRVGFEGAAGYYGIQPDVVAFGKVIGGGLPVGAYAASAKVMDTVAPLGPVYQAGTLSGNPVAMSAGIAQLTECLKPGFYEDQEERTQFFVNRILGHTQQNGYAFNMFSIGSIFWIAFSEMSEIKKASEIDGDSMTNFQKLHKSLLGKGVYLAPSGYEVGFISQAHTKEYLTKTADLMCETLDEIFA